MGAEHDRASVWNLIQLVDENRTHSAQPIDDIAVVDDLVAHVDRCAEALERELDDLDRAVHAGAESARIGDKDL